MMDFGENLVLNAQDARQAIIMMLIDDGINSKSRRKNLFSEKFKYAACSFGDHRDQKTLCCIAFVRFLFVKGDIHPLMDATMKFQLDKTLEETIKEPPGVTGVFTQKQEISWRNTRATKKIIRTYYKQEDGSDVLVEAKQKFDFDKHVMQ